jgi:hypothetical protein
MNNIIKTVENFNPLINNVKEYYKEEDIVKENYKNDDFSLIGSIISFNNSCNDYIFMDWISLQ